MALRSLHTNNSPDPFLNLAQFISDFVTFLVSSHCSTLDPRLTIPWKENIPDFANSSKSMKGNSFFSELAIRYWSHCNNFFLWCPVPIYVRRERHWALEHALIQLWQPKLNFPFISQMFIPRKGIIHRQPFSNSRQFGIRTLWRKKRWKHTGKNIRALLHSPLFVNRVRLWSLLQDLGSNTRKRYEQTQFIRSLHFSLHGCYGLRRLAQHLPETHLRLALQAIDGAIAFRRGKSIGRVRPFKSPWLLTHRLTSHVRQILLTWFHGIKDTAVTFHEPSLKVVFSKHPSLMDAICYAVQNWSDDIAPTCQCAILRQYPTARAHPNLDSEHWVLDGALLGTLLPGALGQMVGGSLNNKIFPNKKTLKKLFLDAFYLWCKQNAIPCPPERWLTQQFDPLWTDHQTRLSDHLTAATIRQLQEQFPECIFHNEDKRASSFEFFAHANIFPVSTRLSVIQLFLRAHWKPRQPVYRLLCNTCGTNLGRATPGLWELETSYLQATFWPKARSNMPQDAQLLVFLLHLSSQC